MLASVDEIIERLGGTARAAELAGVTPAAVSNWRFRKQIPSNKYIHINQALTRLGSAASPDVFGFRAPQQAAS